MGTDLKKLGFMTVEDLLNLDIPARKYEYVQFDKRHRTIDFIGEDYSVDLDRCTTAGACLDWIHQLHEKVWMTPEVLEEFIDMLFEHIDGKLWQWKM